MGETATEFFYDHGGGSLPSNSSDSPMRSRSSSDRQKLLRKIVSKVLGSASFTVISLDLSIRLLPLRGTSVHMRLLKQPSIKDYRFFSGSGQPSWLDMVG